jgi:branched-subunit amino acid ABC-type transport system permease component
MFSSVLAEGFTGISLGSILLLAALGLAITYGLMGVINMAHGELIMIGAYATWLVQVAFNIAVPDLPKVLLAMEDACGGRATLVRFLDRAGDV